MAGQSLVSWRKMSRWRDEMTDLMIWGRESWSEWVLWILRAGGAIGLEVTGPLPVAARLFVGSVCECDGAACDLVSASRRFAEVRRRLLEPVIKADQSVLVVQTSTSGSPSMFPPCSK